MAMTTAQREPAMPPSKAVDSRSPFVRLTELIAGIEPFRQAVAQWLGRRYALPRPVDPDSEVLVLNGTREGLFLAAIAARRWRRWRPKTVPRACR